MALGNVYKVEVSLGERVIGTAYIKQYNVEDDIEGVYIIADLGDKLDHNFRVGVMVTQL